MDVELRKAIGGILAGDSTLAQLLKSGAKSIYFGREPEIDAASSIPLVRFFDLATVGDQSYLNPQDKVEVRLQVDAIAESDLACDAIASHFPRLLAVPGRRTQPINTQNWCVDRFYYTGSTRLQITQEAPGGGKRIRVLSTDWTFFAKRITDG